MIYLLRHGLDDETYVGGWSEVDLSTIGISQVKEVAKFISENKLNIERIYSSDIKRAVTTAEIVSKELDLVPKYTANLRELDKGLLTGMKLETAKKKFPEYFKGVDIYTKYPEGESMWDLYIRAKNLFDKIIVEDKILIITHRGIINMIYFLLNNREPDMDKNQFQVTHASLHELDIQKKHIKKMTCVSNIK